MESSQGELPGGHYCDVLVVIDFEATCDNGDPPKITSENQEIIEFPWVVFDLHTGEVIDQKQVYIRPEWSQEITKFCSDMTKITWDKVQDAPHLAEVMTQFDDYVHENFTSSDRTFCILTDGIWDLKAMLLRETNKKGIERMQYFKTFFNLKAEYAKARGLGISANGMGITKPSIKRMVDDLDLQWTGRQHSGLDDCLNICQVVRKLLEYNHVFAEPEVITEDYNPDVDPLIGDYNKNPTLFLRLPEDSTEETNCAVLRGLPWNATEEDVNGFFGGNGRQGGSEEDIGAGIPEGGIHIIHNKFGKPAGIAYVEFVSTQHCARALTKNKAYMGQTGRYIEVYPTDVSKMETVLELVQKWETEEVEEGVEDENEESGGVNGSGQPFELRQGDWYCPSCREHQFATRMQCRRCGTRKPAYLHPRGMRGGRGGFRSRYPSVPFTGRRGRGMRGGHMIQPHHPYTQIQPIGHAPHHPHQHDSSTDGGAVNFRPGDWACSACHDVNFASRAVCRKCSTPANLGTPAPITTPTVATRPHSNSMRGHSNDHFAMRSRGTYVPFHRGSGHRGGAPYHGGRGGHLPYRPIHHPGVPMHARHHAPAHDPPGSRPGDWMCSSCNDINYATRTVCRKCQAPAPQVQLRGGFNYQDQQQHQPQQYQQQQQPQLPQQRNGGQAQGARSGDWMCLQCNDSNFATRAVCRHCGRPRPQS